MLLWLAFYWACFQFKKFRESIIEMSGFYHGVARCKFVQRFPSNCRAFWFVHILGSIELITLMWVSWLERSSLPAEVEHRWCHRWWCHKWNKGQGLLLLITGSARFSGLICLNSLFCNNVTLNRVQRIAHKLNGGTCSFRKMALDGRRSLKTWCHNSFFKSSYNWNFHLSHSLLYKSNAL